MSDTGPVEQIGETHTLSYLELQYVMLLFVQDTISPCGDSVDSPAFFDKIYLVKEKKSIEQRINSGQPQQDIRIEIHGGDKKTEAIHYVASRA